MCFGSHIRVFLVVPAISSFLAFTVPYAQSPGVDEKVFPEIHGLYLGQPPPGEKPLLFAPGIISTDLHDDFGPTFTPNGKEVFFRCIGAGKMVILYMQLDSGVWTYPEIASFSGQYNDLGVFISYDGSRLFFSSDRPTCDQDTDGDLDIFAVDRLENGWGDAYSLFKEDEESADRFACSIDSEGTIYFYARDSGGIGGYDLYRITFYDSVYSHPEILKYPVNTKYDETCPCIAHDGSFLVYSSSGGPVGAEVAGLYVTFFDKDGSWTQPANLSKRLGMTLPGKYPTLSPDGKYLFFVVPESADANSRLGRLWELDVFRNAKPRYGGGNVYWVNTAVIEALRPDNSD